MKKQYCHRGHDRTVPGALQNNGACKECVRVARAAYVASRQGQEAVARSRANETRKRKHMATRFGKRGAGEGVVHKRKSSRAAYEAWGPGAKHQRGESIGVFETLHAATRALNAWWTVQALLALLATQEQAEAREAS